MKKAVVIGSGIGGIASALRLRKKGYAVEVFEAFDQAGGKLGIVEGNNFRFDMGPSLFTLPRLVDELFELYGKNPKDYFEYYENPISCNYFFEDGQNLSFYIDKQQLSEEIEKKLNVSAQPLLKYLEDSRKMYEISAPIFLERSLHITKNYFKKDVWKALINLPKLQLNKNMHQVGERKLNHPKLVQIMDRYATYNGSDPNRAPGVLTMIPHLEQNIGTYFPKKGMRSIVESLLKLAEENGIKIHTSAPVEGIITEQKKATGIKVNGEKIMADVVVSNADIYYTYSKLLPQEPRPDKQLDQERSSSALIFYWGINKEFKELDLHNIFFSEDYEKEFNHLFQKEKPYEDPTVYVHVSSKLVKEEAPEGKENWFVMVNTPIDKGQDWNEIQKEVKKQVLKKLGRILKTNIEDLIAFEDVLTPKKIDLRTGSYQGALYGTSSNHKYSAFLRHPNFKKSIKNLYFCGGSVHPGGGIPLCLLSAKIVADLCPEAPLNN